MKLLHRHVRKFWKKSTVSNRLSCARPICSDENERVARVRTAGGGYTPYSARREQIPRPFFGGEDREEHD